MARTSGTPPMLPDASALLTRDLPRMLRDIAELEGLLGRLARSVRTELVALPNTVWAGDAKQRAVARGIEQAEFTRRIQATLRSTRDSLHDQAAVAAACLARVEERCRHVSGGSASHAELTAELATLTTAVAELIRRTDEGRLLLRRVEASHLTAVQDMRDGVLSTTAGRSSADLSVTASRIVTSKKSTPAMVAAALLGASAKTLAAQFRDAVSRRVFSNKFVRDVKRLMIAKSGRAELLNQSITDWKHSPDGVKRRPVFIDLPVFAGQPRPTDVVQGDLGDCWVLATLSTVAAHDPGIITRMVEDNFDGTYTVRFADGVSVLVAGDVWLDADIFMDGTSPSVAGSFVQYAGSNSAQWPWIIEKAFAQRFGSYGILDGGLSTAAFDLIVGHGGYGRQLIHDGSIVEWEEYSVIERQPQQVTVLNHEATHSQLLEVIRGMSVIGMHEHAYAVLGTEVIAGETWVRLYNPQGTDTFAGDINGVPVRRGPEDDGVVMMRLTDLPRAGMIGVEGVR